MANNRIELATLPRHIDVIPGKTSTSGLLLQTELIAFTFDDLTAAGLAITGAAFTERLRANTLALIGTTDTGLYKYVLGAARENDSWVLIGSMGVDLTSADAALANGTIITTYTLNVNGMPDVPTIPIATWAQDTTTLIPREKLPDTTYGDQFHFPNRDDRNAGTNATNGTGTAVAMADIIWHQNDIAIVDGVAGRTAFVYIGPEQTVAAATTDADWLQLGAIVVHESSDFYFTVVGRETDAIPVIVDDGTDGTVLLVDVAGQDQLTFTGVSLPTAFILSINGIVLIKGLDYTFTGAIITLTEFMFAIGSTDVVYVSGSSI